MDIPLLPWKYESGGMLMLPVTRVRQCLTCRDTEYDGKPAGGYWIEHVIDPGQADEIRFERCAFCDERIEGERQERHFSITLWRGMTPWSEHDGYEGWEGVPFICLTDASDADWEADRHHGRETWLFFRNRAEWRAAWRAARIIKGNVGRFWNFVGMADVAAYKPAGSDLLTSRFRDGKEGI